MKGSAASVKDAVAAGGWPTLGASRGKIIVRRNRDSQRSHCRRRGHRRSARGGAQIISTDYEAKVPGIDYVVEIPSGTPSRCAPGLAPPDCTSLSVENPSALGPP